MKNLIATVWMSLALAGISACSKDNKNEVQNLQVSQAGVVHIGQPVTFTFPAVAVNSNISWSVADPSGAGSVSSIPNGNSLLVKFPRSGTYTVTGILESVTATSQIQVDSVNYFPVNGTTVQSFNATEQLKITASRNDSSATASGLIFSMQTIGSYSCQSSSLSFSAVNGTGTYSITLAGVTVPLAGCVPGISTAGGTTKTKVPLPDGTTTLTIVFNGTTYSGNIVKAGNAYTINWNYTKGVLLSPASL